MKKILIGILVVVVCAGTAFVAMIYMGLRRLGEEDRVPRDYTRVLQAICAYSDTNGVAPSSLKDLTPQFLPAIPAPRSGEMVFYKRMTDLTNWTFAVTTDVGSSRWTYFQASTASAHPETSTNQIGTIHCWRIFQENRK
ncbi:MAG: hypothetical protein PHV34_07760 [Verrucomicrobiae bacterium]|nr:hypothetical protein [Verrucomicrobiae bacterium]